MALPQPVSGPPKMSFAKIAAMPAPGLSQAFNPAPKDAPTVTPQPDKHPRRETVIQYGHTIPNTASITNDMADTVKSMAGLTLVPPPSQQTPPASSDSLDEVNSELSNSSLNKPHSFDTKSLASVTTFAMDDKESIRPDDSASVRAADDDLTNPVLSRHHSFQNDAEQSQPKPARFTAPAVTMAPRRYATLTNPPRFGSMPVTSPTEPVILPPIPTMPVIDPDEPREPVVPIIAPPDEKLLDALSSPKDRMPLLQLEQKLLTFVRSSPSDVLELPPQNAFSRLLTHKLADYYGLAHHISEDNTSVRIYRAGYRALPTPLATLAQAISSVNEASSGNNTIKIMRRQALGPRMSGMAESTAPSSSNPSKPTSESGAEINSEEGLQSPLDGTPNRDRKLTQEEKAVRYQAARDRIFADFQESTTSESASTGEHSASMSRSSSASGNKKKTKKYKQPKDDSFDPRSAFVPNYSVTSTQYAMPYPENNYASEYPGLNTQYNAHLYGATPTQNYAAFDMNGNFNGSQPYIQGSNQLQAYNMAEWQQAQAYQAGLYGFPNPGMYQQQPPILSPGNSQMSYSPGMGPYQGYFGMPSGPYSPSGTPNSQATSGQAFEMNDHRNYFQSYTYPQQAPSLMQRIDIHGNGSKSLFNPQTRAFVPATPDGRGSARGNRKKNNGRQSQQSNNGSRPSTNYSNASFREDSLQQRYGTPASLPKKPPPADGKTVANDAAKHTAAITVAGGDALPDSVANPN